jgi:hypothetical protein
VTDGVEEPDMQHVAVDSVVERVTADLVTGLEDRADRRHVGRVGQRRQLVPDDLGSHLHRQPAADPFEGVPVQPATRDRLGEQRRHREQVVPLWRHRGGGYQLDHAEPFGAVDQRKPEPVPVLGGGGKRLAGGERPAGQRRLDQLRLALGCAGAVQRHECHLSVVDEV